jgi:hypothetical protein
MVDGSWLMDRGKMMSDLALWEEAVPCCKNCGEKLIRWGWFESKNEPVKYWYCMKCDFCGVRPFIQVFPNPDYVNEKEEDRR